MSLSVLIVEDTELLRRMYSDRIAQEGYRVLTAADGLEALSVLRGDTPDLILLDLIMPKMSGLEVLDLIKRDPRLCRIPVLILTNLGQEEDMQRAVEMGAIDYLIKNEVRPNDVAEKITAVLKVTGSAETGVPRYRVLLRDREGDADALVRDAGLTRRFWCPACEVELVAEMQPKPGQKGWYDTHLVCPECSREY